MPFCAQNSKSHLTSFASPRWGAFLLVEIALEVTELVVNCVTSSHWQSKLRGACQKSSLFRLKRRLGGPLAVRDCALVPYKYAIFFVPECGVPRQVVQRLSIGPAPSGAFPLVRVRCRPGALLLLFFFLPSSSFFLISARLDFSFYDVVIPELCFLFYNNRGHYTGLILVCIPFSVFERNFVFYSVHRRSPHNDRASISHFRHKSRGFVWFSERPLHPTGQCRFVRKILSHTLQVSPPLGGERFFL